MPKSNIKFIPIQNKSVIVHVCFVLYISCLYICVCKCLLQNNNHKSKHKIAEVPSSQAFPVFLITAPPSLCVPAVLVALAVWIQNQENKKNSRCAYANKFKVHCGSAFEQGASGLPDYCTSICVRSSCTRRASCVDSKPKKEKKRNTP